MKNLFAVINSIFVVTAAYFCVEILYKKIAPYPQPVFARQDHTVVQRTTVSGKKTPASAPALTRAITERNLFKVEVEEEKGPAPVIDTADLDPDKLEHTNLKLVLWGTVTGGSNKFAVIEDKNARQQSLYLLGDTVQGAEVKKILREKVVLFFQGKDQVLEMETDTKKVSTRKVPAMNIPARLANPLSKLNMNDLAKSAAGLMRQIKFRPHFTEGEPDGLMVYGIRPNSVFRQIGLRNGDIVKEINGSAITSKEDAVAMFDEIIQSEEAKLTLFRRGKTKELVYSPTDGDETDKQTAVIE